MSLLLLLLLLLLLTKEINRLTSLVKNTMPARLPGFRLRNDL